jgi:glycosyltransferase involved in cell wall biosynthesis
MACGLRCVTTDVGDARQIVSDRDPVVPARDPRALAEAILRRLDDAADDRAQQRERVVTRFSLAAMIDRYELALASLAN